MSHEELDRKQFSLESITVAARGDEIAQRMRSTMRQGIDVIEGGVRKLERRGAVDTASTAVAHRGAFNRVLVVGSR
jgi:hypothetical protein